MRTLNTMVVTTTLPAGLVEVIDKKNGKVLESRSAWMRRAAYDLAMREGIIRTRRDEAAAIDIEAVIG